MRRAEVKSFNLRSKAVVVARGRRASLRRQDGFRLDKIRPGVLLAVQPPRHGQALRPKEFGVEQLRLVSAAVVREDRDDRLARSKLARKPNSPGDVHAR